MKKKVSEICRETHYQDCFNCDDLKCGDNMSTAALAEKLAPLSGMIVSEPPAQFTEIAGRLIDLDKVSVFEPQKDGAIWLYGQGGNWLFDITGITFKELKQLLKEKGRL